LAQLADEQAARQRDADVAEAKREALAAELKKVRRGSRRRRERRRRSRRSRWRRSRRRRRRRRRGTPMRLH
jgi:hypothetical protein